MLLNGGLRDDVLEADQAKAAAHFICRVSQAFDTLASS